MKQLHRESEWELQKTDSSVFKLRDAMAKMMTVFFESHEKALATNLICLNGIRNCTDLLAHCFAQDGFKISSSNAYVTYTDLVQRTGVEVFPIEIVTSEKENPILTIEKVM